jgi:formylglycine-generating enzyme required for sulfatase activity
MVGDVSVALSQAPKPKDGPLEMKFVPLPKATFYMGSRGEKTEIKEDFEIAIHTVTQGQWQAVMGNNPSSFSRKGFYSARVENIKDEDLKQFPVETVSWDDAQEFIKKLNESEKKAGSSYLYRLPKETEWEYACRGGATTKEECSYLFYFDKPSNDLTSKQANFNGRWTMSKGKLLDLRDQRGEGPSLGRPAKVGSYPPNKVGLYDMHGNIYQWCDETTWEGARQGFYKDFKVIRGGCFDCDAGECRAIWRNWHEPSSKNCYRGFRLARVLIR